MSVNKSLLGAALGVLIAVVWVTFDGAAVLLVLGLAGLGWFVGLVLDRPGVLIGLLERLQDR